MMNKWMPVLVCSALLMTGCGSAVPDIGETVGELIEAVHEDLSDITGMVTGGPEALIGKKILPLRFRKRNRTVRLRRKAPSKTRIRTI